MWEIDVVTSEKIVEIIASSGVVADMGKFQVDKNFKENGIDSLDVYSIFLAVEEQLGVKFSEEEAARINTVAAFVEALKAR
ncbi:MAG TPA: phosphopantetheine-binding protein [Rhodocyclaceae bacterium]